jgi:hypothetical protein
MREWWYWHIHRKTEKFIPWVARKLPARLKYFVVIDGMSREFERREDIHPENITAMDLLGLWERKGEGTRST